MEYRTLAIATTLKMTVAAPTTSMMKARLVLNGMSHRWRLSGVTVDLDQIDFQVSGLKSSGCRPVLPIRRRPEGQTEH